MASGPTEPQLSGDPVPRWAGLFEPPRPRAAPVTLSALCAARPIPVTTPGGDLAAIVVT